MAEWWNKEYEFKIWSSLWVFLKEVEGLEEKLVIHYLERLLEKRYDTVDVLALATKQDLVDDANIVPGDALRIIAATKELGAHRDVDCAEPSQNEKKCGGEVRSDFPQIQAKVRGFCHCQVEIPRSKVYRQPYQPEMIAFTMPAGKKDADRMQQGEDDGRRTAVPYAGTTKSGELVISPQAYHCSLCNIKCTGKKNLVMHFKGRRHQALMEEVSDDEDEEDLQSVPSRPTVPSRSAVPPRAVVPHQPTFLQPAFPRQLTGLCTQDWRSQMKNSTRGFANLSLAFTVRSGRQYR